MIGHRKAYAGNLLDNPVHKMSRRVAGLAGVDFICNVTLSEDRAITGVFSGDLDEAHTRGIAHVDLQTKVPCRVADIVITTAAGYPLDTTLYQCVKGMLGAMPAIKQRRHAHSRGEHERRAGRRRIRAHGDAPHHRRTNLSSAFSTRKTCKSISGSCRK